MFHVAFNGHTSMELKLIPSILSDIIYFAYFLAPLRLIIMVVSLTHYQKK